MNKKNKQFFGTNISEEDMKDTNLYITENTELIGLGAWDRAKFEAGWEERKKDMNIRTEKSLKNISALGIFAGLFGWVFNYTTAVNAFGAIDSSYADTANFFIGVSGVGFALFAGYMAHTFITSTFDWFEARKNLIELGR
jgi:nicotinamide riboside transporter PnuC